MKSNKKVFVKNDQGPRPSSNAEFYKNYLLSYDYFNVANNPIYYSMKGDRPMSCDQSAFEELDALLNSNKFQRLESKNLPPQKDQESIKSTSLSQLSHESRTKLDSLPEIKLKSSNKSIENLLMDSNTFPFFDSIKSCQVTNKLINQSSPDQFKTSIYIGPDFGPEDISVQLVDHCYRASKKLVVHCLKIEPIQSNSLTINTSKLAAPTIIDLDLTKGNNCLKRELKKDIYLPENSDLNTLESYLENCHLFIKCTCIRPPVYTTVKCMNQAKSREYIFQNPLYTENTGSALKPSSSVDDKLNKQGGERPRRAKQSCRSVKRPKSNEGFLNEQKSVRFDEKREEKGRSKSRSIERHLSSSHRLINDEMLEDGFNCVTRDPMDNIYLTYFFKLPGCSPSDRTQVRIEKNILKLRIIQETSMRKKVLFNEESSSSSASLTSTCESSLDSIDSDSTENNEKLMFREFSRQCKLPDNFFKFDEAGVSVSFVRNGWVRIEIPIVEFFDFNCALSSKQSKSHRKKGDKYQRESCRTKNGIYANEVRV